MNPFFDLAELTDDPLALTYRECMLDPNPNKVNLCVGIYADDAWKPFVFESIKKAAKEVDITNNDYYIIQWNSLFLQNTGRLIYGENFDSEKYAMQQVCGGAHAISIFSQLLKKQWRTVVYLGLPTWTNHQGIFEDFELRTFDHLKFPLLLKEKGWGWGFWGEVGWGSANLEAYKKAFEEAPEYATFIIHVWPTHNPTGVNITASQICEWADLINKKNICLLLDAAYMGFGNGLEADLEEIRIFDRHIHNYTLAFSHSKNASLYKQKVGALYMKTSNKKAIESHIRRIVHRSISNPPGFGVEIMNIVHEKYQQEWKKELENVRLSLQNRRDTLTSLLPERFSFIREGKGLFSILWLPKNDVQKLRTEFWIYIPKSSRISFGWLKKNDLKYLGDVLQSFY